MDTNAFYATASGLCFTLLGFWWVVVQFRHDDLTSDGPRRRLAFVVSLHFVIPGIMSLASLLAGDNGLLWRIAFGSAGPAGSGRGRDRRPPGRPRRDGNAGDGPASGMGGGAAVSRPHARRDRSGDRADGVGLVPLQVEGYVLTTIVLLGILFAWALFTEPTQKHDADAEAH